MGIGLQIISKAQRSTKFQFNWCASFYIGFKHFVQTDLSFFININTNRERENFISIS